MPFPHVERAVIVNRPALVISAQAIGLNGSLAWVAMITNAAREFWPGDVAIEAWLSVGLIVPSKIRTAKISAIGVRSATRLGEVDRQTLGAVRARISHILGLDC